MQSLFVDTIYSINIKDYTSEQLYAWTSSANNTDLWIKRFIESQYCLIATIDNILVGFASLDHDYIDMMYVHKDYQGQGIGRSLINELLNKALKENLEIIYADVSTTAIPFFERMGWEIVDRNVWKIEGVEGVNWRMRKGL